MKDGRNRAEKRNEVMPRPELPESFKVYPRLVFAMSLIVVGIAVGGGLTGVGSFVPFIDFIAFYSAAELAMQGSFPAAYDDAVLSDLQAGYGWWEGRFTPWFYPPSYLFTVFWTPYLPLILSGALFAGATALVFALAVRPFLGDSYDLWWVLASPVLAINLLLAQNGLLIAALALFAARFLERGPVLSGLMIALMTIKPHLGVLWPVFLIAQRRWLVFLTAIAGTLALVAASAAIFGVEGWILFFDQALFRAQSHLGGQRLPAALSASVFAGLSLLGVQHWLALACHAAVALLVVALVVRLCLQGAPPRLVLAFALCASLFVAPHNFTYDWALVLAGTLIIWREVREGGFLPYEPLLLTVGHLAPFLITLLATYTLPIAPVLLVFPVAAAWRRARYMAKKAKLPSAAA